MRPIGFYIPMLVTKENHSMVRSLKGIEKLSVFLSTAIIANSTSSDAVAEATVTHVLLAFHMLFINILLLNLLVAVFTYVH